jgi:hypothetical protein
MDAAARFESDLIDLHFYSTPAAQAPNIILTASCNPSVHLQQPSMRLKQMIGNGEIQLAGLSTSYTLEFRKQMRKQTWPISILH